MFSLHAPDQVGGVPEKGITDAAGTCGSEFHRRLLAHPSSGAQTHWMGQRLSKLPGDMVIIQEILTKVRPRLDRPHRHRQRWGLDWFLATICDLLDHGQVISIDPQAARRPSPATIASPTSRAKPTFPR
jgi:cephalosporin hydroxylase